MEQTRCPSCGGHKVSVLPVQEIQNQDKIDQTRLPRWFVYIAAMFVAIFAIGAFGAFVNSPIAILMTVGVFGFIVLGFVWFANKASIPRPVIITRSYNGCLLCGSRWDWFPGNPQSEGQVNPELTPRGSEILRDE